MELTTAQQAALSEASLVELRSPQEMLSLLLIEGLRFYFVDREQQWYRKDDQGHPIRFKEDDYIDQLLDELMETWQIKTFVNDHRPQS
jgi:hypothetical protein